jgi:hypothetical protein
MNDKLTDNRNEVLAARSIGQVFVALDEKKKELTEVRKVWRDRVGAAEAALRGAISADDDGHPGAARAKLNQITLCFEDLEEAEAGRKEALHLLLETKKELEARLKKQIAGAKQLGLFDSVWDEETGEVCEAAPAN